MKIEKLSENQIRCTLNKSDLASRQLKISELAYGSEKAKELFRDMMQQASYELGFEADDIPIMIEAIPVSADCIVLIVTKVDDPEELDTRFSKFSPSVNEDDDSDHESGFQDYDSLQTLNHDNSSSKMPTAKDELISPKDENADSDAEAEAVTNDVMNLFSKVKDYLNKSIADIDPSDHSINKSDADNSETDYGKPAFHDSFVPLQETLGHVSKDTVKAKKEPVKSSPNKAKNASEKVVRIFSFPSFEVFSEAAVAVNPVYNDKNTLYKDPVKGIFYLSLERSICTAVNFNKTCNILSEYGKKEQLTGNSIHYFDEHLESIIKNRAIQVACRI